ncbi:MAG: hypothetical protein KKE84_07435 [Gammaproteobacteria bacterium]|nr:hypothetical protein [Gammaproteobacteria bacterium]
MVTDSNDIVEKLIAQSPGRRTTKLVRFLLNVLSSTPVLGGVFSATAAAWSESEQTDINQLTAQLLKITDEKVDYLKSDLVSITNRSHVVAGHVTFETNGTIRIVEASEISSLTDNGRLDFTINFTRPFAGYVFNYYGSGPVALQSVSQAPSGVRLVFQEPAPERVTVVFFELQPNPAFERDAPKAARPSI